MLLEQLSAAQLIQLGLFLRSTISELMAKRSCFWPPGAPILGQSGWPRSNRWTSDCTTPPSSTCLPRSTLSLTSSRSSTVRTLRKEFRLKNVHSNRPTVNSVGLEEIVRVHKISCLKITCLFVCKDTLWIGTSAGVIVNIKVPHISNTTSKLNTSLSYNGKFRE